MTAMHFRACLELSLRAWLPAALGSSVVSFPAVTTVTSENDGKRMCWVNEVPQSQRERRHTLRKTQTKNTGVAQHLPQRPKQELPSSHYHGEHAQNNLPSYTASRRRYDCYTHGTRVDAVGCNIRHRHKEMHLTTWCSVTRYQERTNWAAGKGHHRRGEGSGSTSCLWIPAFPSCSWMQHSD